MFLWATDQLLKLGGAHLCQLWIWSLIFVILDPFCNNRSFEGCFKGEVLHSPFCKIRRYNQGIIYFRTGWIIHYQIQVFFIVSLKTFCSKCVTGWRTGFKSLNLFQTHSEWFSGKERLYITLGSSPRFVCLTWILLCLLLWWHIWDQLCQQ